MCKKMEKFNNFEKWSKNHNKNKTNKGTLMKVDESKKVWKKPKKVEILKNIGQNMIKTKQKTKWATIPYKKINH